MEQRHVDVLIIGAGLSGISAACHLAEANPGKSYTILERRGRVGGTWDLFRYPGIRSDSDMYTFGYRFRAWHGTKVLADGHDIRRYVQETADEFGVSEHIRFGRKVVKANWSSEAGRWTVQALDEATGETEVHTCDFLVNATGYYDYDAGHRPGFPGEERFGGTLVHPQQWPEDLDYRGKRVVVIGSGATAITLVPAMAADAAHVTMLQRSPTYIMTLPHHDPVSVLMRKAGLPADVVYRFGRSRNIALQRGLYALCRSAPGVMRKVLLAGVRAQVGKSVDMRHFTPSYKPWDQRLCVVPGGDLFKALKSGEASVVTDHIDTFTETGIRLKSGEEIPADIVITATGLRVQLAGGAELEVDGRPIATRDHVIYKGVMLDGVPNLAIVLGYTNASWTLKADMAAEYVSKLLTYMDQRGVTQVTPIATDADRAAESAMGDSLSSGYIARGDAVMPRQGTRAPWKIWNNYYRDRRALRRSPIDDPALRFARRAAAPTVEPAADQHDPAHVA
ncbi:NAD(P)/FAD-dependent oxidoreductase [Streptomyces sp. V3I7]|uniref:flavin-containing monooxygenase n=1 Tax=Streptomyces sp. V3I7 TaxID=3042278 RepID=UPI00277E9CEB|nr:NAD(P)/FAD-dependent oxidoreductase [Streptomyces sp. V3I7]MDQ0994048.1 cation diffusion facilitator CzcD-associated flavoprotein CzcO [Streptomyces sp. V3I7]